LEVISQLVKFMGSIMTAISSVSDQQFLLYVSLVWLQNIIKSEILTHHPARILVMFSIECMPSVHMS
jgi:hypothetical protein